MPHRAVRPRRIVIVSDFRDGDFFPEPAGLRDLAAAWAAGERGPPPGERLGLPEPDEPAVVGGYLERLPLAVVRSGICDCAEIWTFWAREQTPPFRQDSPFLVRRAFRPDGPATPYASTDMLAHIAAFGTPDILCIWGLGVDEAILTACADSVKIYNSIDAPALRVPRDVSRHFDIVLTGAEWQSREVEQRHPGMTTAVLPIGPEFASPDTFFPLGIEKSYDFIYVAAAQAYKRHDILFDALAKLPRCLRTLCVFGYGELGCALRQQAQDHGLAVDFVGPPGVDFDEVNRLMNLARIGMVCGVDDGAPAILTEYMLAGLPVLANAELKCGLQFITPLTGRMASASEFDNAMLDMLTASDGFEPRETAVEKWSWPRTIQTFSPLIAQARHRKRIAANMSPHSEQTLVIAQASELNE